MRGELQNITVICFLVQLVFLFVFNTTIAAFVFVQKCFKYYCSDGVGLWSHQPCHSCGISQIRLALNFSCSRSDAIILGTGAWGLLLYLLVRLGKFQIYTKLHPSYFISRHMFLPAWHRLPLKWLQKQWHHKQGPIYFTLFWWFKAKYRFI